MANYMWLVPTKNKEEFKDIDRLQKLLQNQFSEYLFIKEKASIFYQVPNRNNILIVYKKVPNDTANPSLVLGDKKYFFLFAMELKKFDLIENTQEFIDELDKLGLEELTDKFLYYQDDMDRNNSIEIRRTPHSKDINKVSKWISWYFQAFWFDEGIHPEFIPPYKENPVAKKRIFSFDLFRKKSK